MRHRKPLKKLGRRSGHRRATLRHLVVGLFLAQPTSSHAERIITTPAKAKAARRLAEKLITLGKKGTLAARRRALQLLPNKPAVRKLFDEIAPRYVDRPGGYTRILRLGERRVGDDAPQVLFELVGISEELAERPVQPTVDLGPEPEEEPAEPEEEEAPESGEAGEEPEQPEPAPEDESGGTEEDDTAEPDEKS
ncbi:MAG: 50S ribosomal protein L17 [Planctomycetota bacterium]